MMTWRLSDHPRLNKAVTVVTVIAMVLFVWVSVHQRRARLAERRELGAAVMFLAGRLSDCREECER